MFASPVGGNVILSTCNCNLNQIIQQGIVQVFFFVLLLFFFSHGESKTATKRNKRNFVYFDFIVHFSARLINHRAPQFCGYCSTSVNHSILLLLITTESQESVLNVVHFEHHLVWLIFCFPDFCYVGTIIMLSLVLKISCT